ncbi:lipoate--protein ligase [uncultured Oscillibacter sp.]|uniref:lipoate--protein ligase n=1 Tax=uncultured Oscillibacter sp. TaxID=876091 RepID=UPI0026100BD6|nr:lipoate--protein ligase [uncultured Oscillibacter sp.]
MGTRITYLETGSQDPFYNLAFEEYVLTHRGTGDYLLLWQNDNTIVIGQNQNAEEEIDRAFVEAHGIRVVRRTTGGGAVYHDLGNLNYSFITDAGEAEKLTMERFTRPVVNALRGLGLRAEASGRNDILVEGRKVSGTAQRLLDGRILHHGTLLFDADPGMVAGALRADPEKFRSKSAKSVRSRIGNIREFLREDMDLPAFWEYLKTALAGAGFVGGGLTAEELEGVEALKREKYDTWEWNFGRSPAYDMMNRRHWDGGSLEVRLSVKGGRITGIAFLGDFLSRCPLEPLTEALRGVPFRREDVTEVLERQPLSDYFGGITTAEILETIFHVCE